MFRYESDTGKIWRWWPPSRRCQTGRWKETGLSKGGEYLQVCIAKKMRKVHRVAWFIVHGVWPKDELDHEKHKKVDNRLSELAPATHKSNHRNKSKPRTNTSGVTGVRWHKDNKKWLAYIYVDNKCQYLGNFSDFCPAVEARLAAEATHGFHPNHGAFHG